MTKRILNAVTTTTSAVLENSNNFENITIHFHAASVASGNGVLTVLGSNDGTNFVGLNVLVDNVTNTNTGTLTRVASKTLNSNTDVLLGLENLFKFAFLKFTVTVTTDGAYTVWLSMDKKTS